MTLLPELLLLLLLKAYPLWSGSVTVDCRLIADLIKSHSQFANLLCCTAPHRQAVSAAFAYQQLPETAI